MQKNVFRKGLVIGIILLFVGSSFIPNISGENKEKTRNDKNNLSSNSCCNIKKLDDSFYNTDFSNNLQKDILSKNLLSTTWYGYNCIDLNEIIPNGTISFESDNPGDVTLLEEHLHGNFIAGADWCGDSWYGIQYNTGNLYQINTDGSMVLIGDAGLTEPTGLTYDETTDTAYICSVDHIYAIDLNTATKTLVGSWDSNYYFIIGIACGNGVCYGHDMMYNRIVEIDLNNADITVIGDTALEANYAQDIAFDRDNNELYLSAYVWIGEKYDGQLHNVNINTGEATYIGTFENGIEVDGFVIPYTGVNQPPTVEITYPVEGQTVSGNIDIEGTADDPDGTVQLVEVRIDIGSWNTATGMTSWSYEWDTTLESEGWHTIFARSYDGEDYSPVDYVNVNVDNDPDNDPPETPDKPDGPTELEVGEEGTYTTSTTDPDGDQVKYGWDWDGDDIVDEWTGLYDSGETIQITHSWSEEGTYYVKAKAEDEHGAPSEWSDSLPVEVISGPEPQWFYPPFFDNGTATEAPISRPTQLKNSVLTFIIRKMSLYRYFAKLDNIPLSKFLIKLIENNKNLNLPQSDPRPLHPFAEAEADKDTGRVYVKADTLVTVVGKQMARAEAVIIGSNPENQYFSVPIDGNYKITYNFRLSSGIAWIKCDLDTVGTAYGEAVLGGFLYEKGSSGEDWLEYAANWIYMHTDKGNSEYLHNFINDPLDYSCILTYYLNAGNQYYFAAALHMLSTADNPNPIGGDVKAQGELDMKLVSVCVEPIS